MLQDTTFPALWNLFGGSIYRDEYRGNFKEANERIEAQLRSATDNLAGILLAKAVHRLISSNIHEAEQILDNMRAPDSMFGPSWQLRAELYRRIILENGTLLRPFDSCLDLPEFQMNLTNWLQRRTPSRINELNTAWTPEHKIETTWIDQDIWAVRLRTLATQIPSTSPVHPKSGNTDQQKDIIGAVGQPLAGLRQSGCPAGYGLRLQADIFHILESPDSLPKLRESAQAYKSNGDLVGEATCIMKEGDWLCSQRYSNITALNMVICESTSYIGSSRWDAAEDDLALGQINEARSLYAKAQELFHIASAPRGVAAIYMRKACLTLFERLLNGNGDPPRGNDQYSEARANIQTAYSTFLFAGDWLSAKLAETHMIILDIYSSRSDRATAANEIGNWGKQTKNIQYVHGLGLLFLRLGNYTWRKSRTFDTSRLLLQAAQALFAGLDARISEIQAEASGAQILCEVLDLGSARIAFLSAEHKLNDMLSYLAEEQVPSSLWEKQLEIVKSTLAVAMEPLFFYLGETTTLRRLLETVQGIRDNTEVVQERRSREPRLIVHLAKLEYKDRVQEDDMSGAIQCLDQGLNALSALDAKVYGEGRQIARINILGEMMRYDEAKEILQEMHKSQDMDEDFKTYIETTNSRNKEYLMTKRYETFLHLAINVLDFELASHYKHKLETLGNDQYSKKSPHDLPNSAQVLLSLSSLHEGFGEFEEAIIHINACLIAIEANRSNISESSARMTSFGHNEVFEAFDTAMRICFKLHKNRHPTPPSGVECSPRLTSHSWIEQALVFAERGKARTMVDSIQDSLDQLSKDEEYDVNKQVVGHGKRKMIEQITKSAKVVSRLEALIEFSGQGPTEPQEHLREQLSAENSRLAMLEEKFAQAAPEVLVAENRRSFAAIRTYSKSLSIRETAKALPSDTVVLEFATTYNGVGIFAIGTSGILASHWAEISKIDLQQLILDFLLLMKEKNLKMAQRGERINKVVQMLSETLLKPVSDALKGAENIVFVPSGILFNFPLGMLEISSEPLILNYTTAQVPSLTVWQELNRIGQIADKKPKSKVTAAVLCNSKEVVESQLPYVRAEALAISRIFSIKPIVADKVSTSRLRDMGRNCDVFHCCCHGSFDHDAPLLSNIQLHSKAGPGDLSIMDLVTMVGPAKLVVLSACFSGFGKILGSNDGYSFPHALLSIGVRAFVGSLWSSDDGAALIFMYIFYRQLFHGRELKEDSSGDDVSIAQAFTSAQRQLRTMSRTAYNECIDSIISELKAIDSKTSRRVVGMSQQLFRLKVLKEDRDPARFADCFYWAAFVLTGNGLQTLRG